MVSRTRVAKVLGFCLLLGISGVAAAEQGDSSPGESPRVMRIGGVLKDAQGAPRSGNYRVAFAIYAEPEGGSSVWTEAQDVSVGGNARYEVLLGSSRAEGFPAELLASGKLLWLGIQVGEEPEQRPRVMLVSVAHALKADDAATLSGKALSELVQVEQLKTPEGRKQLGLRPMATTDDVFTATANPGPGFISQALTGPPLQVSSSGKVANLNADLLDDLDSAAFAQLAGSNIFAADNQFNSNVTVGGTFTLPSSVLVQAGVSPFLHSFGALNTFVGLNAGNLTMTGSRNAVIGDGALLANTTGGSNTASGARALFNNTTGDANTAVGDAALGSNTTGSNNTASGAFALLFNTTGIFNTASGASALFSNTTGNDNTASGAFALEFNTTGGANTASGTSALRNNTTGIVNTAIGRSAMENNTTGNDNTASGVQALFSNTTGNANTASGAGALAGNTSGDSNTASGRSALESNSTGRENTASGAFALFSNTAGDLNTAIGFNALRNITTGAFNIAIGQGAGANLTTGNNNIHVGHAGFAGEGFTIRIGNDFIHSRTLIAGIRGVTTGQPDAIPVLIDSAGQLGTVSSSARFKEEIEDMGEKSGALLRLRPVTFRYKGSQGSVRHFGLIAEEVEEVLPELVVHTSTGEAETVLYHEMPAMLLNELQKQQRRIETLEARLAELEGAAREGHASAKQ